MEIQVGDWVIYNEHPAFAFKVDAISTGEYFDTEGEFFTVDEITFLCHAENREDKREYVKGDPVYCGREDAA